MGVGISGPEVDTSGMEVGVPYVDFGVSVGVGVGDVKANERLMRSDVGIAGPC
jgi:hypothetical protein